MQRREREETLEAQLHAMHRKIAEAQEDLDKQVAQFQTFQDEAVFLAERFGVLGPELTQEFARYQQEFLDVKRQADQLIDGVREGREQARLELETLRGERS